MHAYIVKFHNTGIEVEMYAPSIEEARESIARWSPERKIKTLTLKPTDTNVSADGLLNFRQSKHS
jgi:hypothetical protein